MDVILMTVGKLAILETHEAVTIGALEIVRPKVLPNVPLLPKGVLKPQRIGSDGRIIDTPAIDPIHINGSILVVEASG